MDQTTLFLQNMLLLHLISKLWHLKLKAMASTFCLKLLCPLHPWLWNQTLLSLLLQSSLLQHPSVTMLNIWGKGRTGRHWSYGVHPINIFISVSISATQSQYQNSIAFIFVSISATRFHLGLSQYLFVFDFRSLFLISGNGNISVSISIFLCNLVSSWSPSPKCFFFNKIFF